MILITGGNGFIGQHLIKELGDEAVSWDIKIGKDIFSNEIIPYVEQAKVIVHLAALTSNERSIEKPEETYKLNVHGTLRMLILSQLYNKKFIFASSSSVYKDTGATTHRESDQLEGKTPYGMSKVEAEYACAMFRSKIPVVVLRLFNVYGPGQNSKYSGVITAFLDQMKTGILNVYGDGEQTRDFTYVKDVVKVIKEAIEDKNWDGKIVNVGMGKRTSVNEIANIFKENNKDILRVQHLPSRVEVRDSSADILNLSILYKDKINTNLKGEIKKMIKEFK